MFQTKKLKSIATSAIAEVWKLYFSHLLIIYEGCWKNSSNDLPTVNVNKSNKQKLIHRIGHPPIFGFDTKMEKVSS